MKNIFFYGLFMDRHLLLQKGFEPSQATIGWVDGFALCIGQRATLLASHNKRAYGVTMSISDKECEILYSEPSVADYEPISIAVNHSDNITSEAICYILPAHKITGSNTLYAESLLSTAEHIGLDEGYLDEIRAIINV